MIEGASLLLVGAGAMGGAMLRRWFAGGLSPERVTVVSPSLRAMPEGVRTIREIPGDEAPDVIVLALKPQQLSALRTHEFSKLAPRLLVSILAGVEEATLDALCGAGAIVRAMPNLPVAIGKGVIALHSSHAGADDRALAESLMAPLGQVEWIGGEALFDAVTALSGSAPAFLFRFIDALAEGGAALGLPADQALRLALATVEGSAAMASASGENPATLAERVASPGGSTRAGLNVLDRGGALADLLTDTLRASERRNSEMAAAARSR